MVDYINEDKIKEDALSTFEKVKAFALKYKFCALAALVGFILGGILL